MSQVEKKVISQMFYNELEWIWTLNYVDFKVKNTPILAVSPDGVYLAVQNENENCILIFSIQQQKIKCKLYKQKQTNTISLSFSQDSQFLIEKCLDQLLVYQLCNEKGDPTSIPLKGQFYQFITSHEQLFLCYFNRRSLIEIYKMSDCSLIASISPPTFLLSDALNSSICESFLFSKSTLIIRILSLKVYYFVMINQTGKITKHLQKNQITNYQNQLKFRLPFFYQRTKASIIISQVFNWKRIRSVENLDQNTIISILDKDLCFVILTPDKFPKKQISLSNQVINYDNKNNFEKLKGNILYPNFHMLINQERNKVDILSFKRF